MNGFRCCAWGAALAALLAAGGCASVTHGTTQSIRVDTLTAAGDVVEGSDCRLTNEKGSVLSRSGLNVSVGRSGSNLLIQCEHEGHAPASGQAVSRVNAGMVGNLVIGGLIGVAIDSGTGAGFNYPTWMKLVFGEVRNFDRNNQTGDLPVAGMKVGETRFAAATPASDTTGAVAGPTAPNPPAPPATAAVPVVPRAAPTPASAAVELASTAPSRPPQPSQPLPPPQLSQQPAPPPALPAAAGDSAPFANTGIDDLRQLLPVSR